MKFTPRFKFFQPVSFLNDPERNIYSVVGYHVSPPNVVKYELSPDTGNFHYQQELTDRSNAIELNLNSN